jgi:shikimate 5-dehydrogenase
MGLVDAVAEAADSLGSRLSAQYSELDVKTGSADPTGYDLVVNATPLGMNEGDPLPIDMNLVAASTFVGEVVMKTAITRFSGPHSSGAAIRRSVQICCSSRSRHTWNSSDSARRHPTSCAR